MKIAKLLSAARVFDVPEQTLCYRIFLDDYFEKSLSSGWLHMTESLNNAFKAMSQSADYFKILDVTTFRNMNGTCIDLTYKALSPSSIHLDQQLCRELEEAEHTIADLNGAIQALEQTNHEQDRKIRRLSQENKAYFIAGMTLLLAVITAAVLGGGL